MGWGARAGTDRGRRGRAWTRPGPLHLRPREGTADA